MQRFVSHSVQDTEKIAAKLAERLKGGEVIAFTFGCQATPDMYVVQIEKADHTIQGAYQMINQQFVQRNCNDVEYVNREEDLGLEGLRKAKKSYYPVMRGVKYVATPKG